MPGTLDRKGSMPIAKIIVGNAQPATYKNTLILANGKRLDIGSGSEVDFGNVDGINSIEDLNLSTYVWDIRVIKATSNPAEVHNIKIMITQDCNKIDTSVDPEGEFGADNVYTWTDGVNFSVS